MKQEHLHCVASVQGKMAGIYTCYLVELLLATIGSATRRLPLKMWVQKRGQH